MLFKKKKNILSDNSINRNLQTIYKSLMKDSKMELILNLENMYIKQRNRIPYPQRGSFYYLINRPNIIKIPAGSNQILRI